MSEETKKDTDKSARKAAAKPAKKTAPKKPAAKKPPPKKPAAKKPAARKQAAEEKIKKDAEYTDFAEVNDSEDATESDSTASSFHENLPNRDWTAFLFRAALLIVYGMLGWLAMWAAVSLAAVGWLTSLIFNEENETLKSWIRSLGNYLKEVMDYMADEKSEMPFPLSKNFPSDR